MDERPKNIIYPEPSKTVEEFSTKTALIVLAGILVIAGIYWFGTRSKKETSPALPPPIQGDVSIQAGFFTVSQTPGRITIKRGDTQRIVVKVMVTPLGDFNEKLDFFVEDITKENSSVRSKNSLTAKFSRETLESKDFVKGIELFITPGVTLTPGRYVIIYRTQSKSVKKNFIVPIIVE